MDELTLRTELERLHSQSVGWSMACCAQKFEDAQEVLQEVYLKILQGRARFGGKSTFKTWLFAVIRTTAADLRRWKWLGRLRWTGLGREHDRPGASREAGGEMERDETGRRVKDALAVLSARQREVLQLVFYHDLSLSEAAEVMAVSIGSARTHYERGKAALRELLREDGNGDAKRRRQSDPDPFCPAPTGA